MAVKENAHRGRAQAAFLALLSVTLGVRIGKLRIQEAGCHSRVQVDDRECGGGWVPAFVSCAVQASEYQLLHAMPCAS